MKIKVNVKSVASRRSGVKAIDFELPEEIKAQTTVGEFLDAVTAICVSQYKKRQNESEILKVLTSEQIEEKSLSGKIGFGVNYGTNSPVLKEAQENSRQCYLDGIFALFVDGKEISGLKDSLPLETPIELHEGSEVTFIRLAMLAGAMW